jgi:hypothetical protein
VNVTPLNVHVTGKADAFDKQANVNTSNVTQPRMENRQANIGNPLVSSQRLDRQTFKRIDGRLKENYAPT